MVYQTPTENLEVLTCYLVADISQDQLQAFKAAFELGNFARFSPKLRIKIVRPPEYYIGSLMNTFAAKRMKLAAKRSFSL